MFVFRYAGSAAFQFEAVRDRHEEVDVLVSRAGVRMVFPMWKERREIDGGRGEGETEAAAADAGPVFVYGRAGIRMRLEWTDVAEGKRPGDGQGKGEGGGGRSSIIRCFVETLNEKGFCRGFSNGEIRRIQ